MTPSRRRARASVFLQGPRGLRKGPGRRTSSAAAPSWSCSPRRCGLPAGPLQPAQGEASGSTANFLPTGQARPVRWSRGTVARGFLREDKGLLHRPGRRKVFVYGVAHASRHPLPSFSRGQERMVIYCTPCHGRVGDGHGMIVSRGFTQPRPPFHSDRLRTQAYRSLLRRDDPGLRPDVRATRAQVPPEDRWAIAAYVRALQLSQYAPAADVAGGQARASSSQPSPRRPRGATHR